MSDTCDVLDVEDLPLKALNVHVTLEGKVLAGRALNRDVYASPAQPLSIRPGEEHMSGQRHRSSPPSKFCYPALLDSIWPLPAVDKRFYAALCTALTDTGCMAGAWVVMQLAA